MKLTEQESDVYRFVIWEKLRRNPDYRAEAFQMLSPVPWKTPLEEHMEALARFQGRWNLSWPIHPDLTWEDLEVHSRRLFVGHLPDLLKYKGNG